MSRETAMAIALPTNPLANPAATTQGDVPRETQVAVIPEGAPPAAPAPAPKDDKLESTRFAQLARREAQIVARQNEVKRKEAELKAIEERETKFQEMKKQNPVEALKSLGFTETDIFNFMAASEPKEPTPEELARKIAQEEIGKLRAEAEAKAKSDETARNTTVLKEFRTELSSFLTQNKDTYEYLAFRGAVGEELVLNTILAGLELNPDDPPMSIEDAAKIAESFYEDDDKAMSTLKKRQPKPADGLEISNPEPKPKEAPVTNVPQPKKTLGPAATATLASQAGIPRKETKSEKRERLMRKLANGG